jgi:hypothetical protein
VQYVSKAENQCLGYDGPFLGVIFHQVEPELRIGDNTQQTQSACMDVPDIITAKTLAVGSKRLSTCIIVAC